MSFRKKAAAFVLCGLVVLVVASVTKGRRQRRATTAFLGWTNTGRPATPHALLLWTPPTSSKLAKNFFVFQFYVVRFDYIYTDPSGRTNAGSDHAYIRSSKSDRIYLTVPPNAVDFRFVQATAWIQTTWDNVRVPVKLPKQEFPVVLPHISSDHLKQLRLLQRQTMTARPN